MSYTNQEDAHKRASTQHVRRDFVVSGANLLVEEGEASDHRIADIFRDIMAEKLHKRKHRKAAVADLVLLTNGHRLRIHVHLLPLGVARVFLVVEEVDGTDDQAQGHPERARDHLESSEAVGHVGKLETWGDFAGEAEHFGDDVAEHTRHGNATVSNLTSLVAIERFLIPILADAQGIKETLHSRRHGKTSE